MSRVIVTPEFIPLDGPRIMRAILSHIISNAGVVGVDVKRRTVLRLEFAAEPWLIDKLACFDADGEDLEDGDEAL